jgi:hypothetical protein
MAKRITVQQTQAQTLPRRRPGSAATSPDEHVRKAIARSQVAVAKRVLRGKT